MATSRQEQLYNEIIEYYNFAERLIKSVEDSHGDLAQDQFELVENAVVTLESCADKLTTEYINFIKSGESSKAAEVVRNTLNDITAKTDECRNRLLMLYEQKLKSENAAA